MSSLQGKRLNAADRSDSIGTSSRAGSRPPLREHVANSVRRYLRDLDGCDTNDLYEIALREQIAIEEQIAEDNRKRQQQQQLQDTLASMKQ